MPAPAPAASATPGALSTADLAPPIPNAAPPRVRRARSACLLLLSALSALCLAWELVLTPTGSGTLAIKVLPLLLCLPGLWRHRLYTYRWLSLLLWLYVTEGLVRGTSDKGLSQALAWGEVALSAALFALCVHYIRLRVPKQPKPSTKT
jgi:uncharacterized membrane protein